MKNIFAVCLLFPLTALTANAQPCTVRVPSAKLTEGDRTVGTVAKGTQLYGWKRDGDYLRCINPETLTPALIAVADVTIRSVSQREDVRLLALRKQVVELVNQHTASQSDLAAARAWMIQCQTLFGHVHPRTVRAWQLTGLVAANSRSLSEGRRLLNLALHHAKLVFGDGTSEVAEIHVDLAYLLADMSLLADAAQQAKAAAIIRARLYGNTHPDTMETFLPLAQALESIADDRAAFELYEKVHSSYEEAFGIQDERTLKVAGRMADAASRTGRNQLAIEIQKRVISTLESRAEPDRRWIARARLKLQFLKLDREQESEIAEFLAAAQQFAKQLPEDVGFASALSRQLVEFLLETQRVDSAFATIDLEMRNLRKALRTDLWDLDEGTQTGYLRFAASGPFYDGADAAWRFRDRQNVTRQSSEWLLNGKGLVREVNAVRAGFRNDARKRAQWIDQAWLRVEDLQSAMPADSVFVDILRLPLFDRKGEEHYVAWLTPQSGRQQIINLGAADTIDQQIELLRRRLRESAMNCVSDGEHLAFEQMRPDLQKLSEQLWHPIERIIDHRIVLLSPDSQCWLVPWSALLTRDGRFAVEQFQFQFHVSGREIAIPQSEAAATESVVFANPDFGEADGKRTSPDMRAGETAGRIPPVNKLENTLHEAAAARIALSKVTQDNVKVLLGGNAAEQAFKQLNSPAVLLMSTHGFFLSSDLLSGPTHPLLRCGLLLANANRHDDHTTLQNDGVLTAMEVIRADLSGTRLVVLSACESGIGNIAAVEGVTGLRSAFRLAGVNCVVSTLWPIHDRETAYLMTEFFGALNSSETAAQALQKAQQNRIERHRERYGAAHPFFWAAFTATGHMNVNSLRR